MRGIFILLTSLIGILPVVKSQPYIKLVIPHKTVNSNVTPTVPDYGSLLETIIGEINLRRDANCLKLINKEVETKIISERTKLGKIENRPINFQTDGVEYLLGIDYKSCKVISLFKNDTPAFWNSTTIIFKIVLYPIIKISNTLTI